MRATRALRKEWFNIGKIPFEGPKSFNPLAFKHYKPDEVVAGRVSAGARIRVRRRADPAAAGRRSIARACGRRAPSLTRPSSAPPRSRRHPNRTPARRP